MDATAGGIEVSFFCGGQLNVATNCVDRHVAAGNGASAAIVWEGDDSAEVRTLTYDDLLARRLLANQARASRAAPRAMPPLRKRWRAKLAGKHAAKKCVCGLYSLYEN